MEPGFVHTGGYYCYEFDTANQIEKSLNGFTTIYTKAQRINQPTELCDQNSISSSEKYMFLIAIYVSEFELYKLTYFSDNNNLDEASQIIYGEILSNFTIDLERN
ncbi:MAG: hypothetical protein N3A71_01610 [Candidatus Dojkabacteria bacterium]|nr:hypothetical protein [Candidatus Dojkabacteria bacterium]